MDELIPVLIFIVVALINFVKYMAEKGGRSREKPKGETPKKKASPLEGFFEDLARKLEPQPTELPEWPEGRERPDYIGEMEEFEKGRPEAFHEEETAEIIPMYPAKPVPAMDVETPAIPEVQPLKQARSLQSAMKSMPGLMSGINPVRISSSPILKSSAAGRIDFPLRERAVLRRAIIAKIIFDRPRAYDTSFDNSFSS